MTSSRAVGQLERRVVEFSCQTCCAFRLPIEQVKTEQTSMILGLYCSQIARCQLSCMIVTAIIGMAVRNCYAWCYSRRKKRPQACWCTLLRHTCWLAVAAWTRMLSSFCIITQSFLWPPSLVLSIISMLLVSGAFFVRGVRVRRQWCYRYSCRNKWHARLRVMPATINRLCNRMLLTSRNYTLTVTCIAHTRCAVTSGCCRVLPCARTMEHFGHRGSYSGFNSVFYPLLGW